MKRLFWFLPALVWLALPLRAQQADYAMARKMVQTMVYTTDIRPMFLPGSDKFWFVHQTPEGENYWFVDPARKEKRRLFDNDRFAGGLREMTGIELDPGHMGIPGFEFSEDGRSFALYPGTFKVTYDFYKQEFTGCDEAGPEPMIHTTAKRSPDGRYEIYARDHNLFVREVATGIEKQLTTDGEPYNSYAVDDEGRSRSGEEKETRAAWLDDSRRVYFSRSDQRRVDNLYLLNSMTGKPSVVSSKYMMPGDLFTVQFSAGVIDVTTGALTTLQIDKWKDQVFDIIYASPASDFLYILRKNRPANEIELCRADTRTGEVKVIIHEVSEPYLNDQLMQFRILNGGRDIIWFSERTGWGHLYHYNGEGRLLNAITEGEWMAGRIVKIDEKNGEFFFEGYGYNKAMNPYYSQLFKANINKTGVKLLTPDDAHHKVTVSPAGYLVDNYSRADTRPVSVLRDRNGKVITELARADMTLWDAGGWQMPELFTVKAADGLTDLYGTMWKPRNFDPSKKYPIITHVYPGPQAENLQLDFHQTGGYNGPLAQLGFIVVKFGNRGGSAHRNRAYHTYGYGNLRDYAVDDNKAGLEQLAERYPFIDLDRVGIFGNSGGGMMTFAAMCNYPDFYKVGVSTSGNHDNRIFNRWWGETHQGVSMHMAEITDPQGNVRRDSVFYFGTPTSMEIARNLSGHLMLVTGDMDDVVHPAATIRLADILIKYGKNFELVVLPGQGHDFIPPGITYYQMKMWLHFTRYLLGDTTRDTLVNFNQLGR